MIHKIDVGSFSVQDKSYRVVVVVDTDAGKHQIARMTWKAARNKAHRSRLGCGLVTVEVSPNWP